MIRRSRIALWGKAIRPKTQATIVPNLAASFSAAHSQYLNCLSNPSIHFGAASFTWTGWICPRSFAGERAVIDNANGGWGDYLIDQTSANLRLYSGSAVVVSNVVLTTNQWYFFSAWRDLVTGTINISMNLETPVSSASTPSGVTGNPLSIGAYANGANSYDGLISSVGLWNRVLTSTEQTWLYNAGSGRRSLALNGLAGLTDGLVSWWDLSEVSGNRVDSFGVNNLNDVGGVTSGPGPG